MATVQEHFGALKINWREIIKKAIDEAPSDQESFEFHLKLTDWQTCACGQIVDIRLTTNSEGLVLDVPLDITLVWLGSDMAGTFGALYTSLQSDEVKRREWLEKKLKTLDEIEARAKFLVDNLPAND